MARGNFLRVAAAFLVGIVGAVAIAVIWFLFLARGGEEPLTIREAPVAETVTEAVTESLKVTEPGRARTEIRTETTAIGRGVVPETLPPRAAARRPTSPAVVPPSAIPGRGEIARALRVVQERLRVLPAVPSQPLAGPIRVRLATVTWSDGRRRPFLRASQVIAQVNVGAAQRGDIVVQNAQISGANVLVERPRPGAQWNYQRVLARLLNPEPSTGAAGARAPRRTVRFANVSLRNTDVRVEDAGNVMQFNDVDALLASVDLSGPQLAEPQIRLARATLSFDPFGPVGPLPVTAADGFFVFPSDYVDFLIARATLGTSRFSNVEGDWFLPRGSQGVTIEGRAEYASLADLQFISTRLPPEASGSFNFAIRPLPNLRREIRLSNADVRARESHVLGAVSMAIGMGRFELIDVNARLEPLDLASVSRLIGREIPFGGTLRGTARGTAGRIAFDLNTHLTKPGVAEPFVSHAFGTVAFIDGQLAIQRVTAELDALPAEALRVFATGLPFSGPISGRVTLNGPPNRAPINVDVRLTVAGGVALVAGTVDLTGAVPAYDLSGRLIGVELRKVLRPSVPPVLLTSRFTVRGSGTNPNTLNAGITMAGRFTGWQTTPRDTLVLNAVVRAGTLDVDTASLHAGPIRLDAGGNWRFVEPMGGALTYNLAVENLAPVAPYMPILGDSAAQGRLAGSGRVEGTLSRMRVVGVLQGRGLAIAGYKANTIDASHDLTLGEPLPRIQLRATAAELVTPQAGTFTNATVNLNLVSPTFALEARANGEAGGVVAIDATGNIPFEGARRVVINRADLTLDGTQWALANPAAIDWAGGDGVRVTSFDMREANGEGRLFAEGRIFPLERIDLRLATADLPIESLQRIAGIEPRITGLLWSEGTIAGPGNNPRIQLDFRLDSGAVRDVGFRRFEGNISLVQQQLQVRLMAALDTAGNLDLRARLPVQITFSPKFKFALQQTGTLDGLLVADSLSIAAFAAAIPQIQQPVGWINGRATLSGTVTTPIFEGAVTLSQGAVTIPAVNQRFTDIHGSIRFTRTRAELDSLVVRKGGTAIARGTIEFETLSNPVANVTVQLTDFEPANVEDRSDAKATGNVIARGPLNELEITGDVLIDDGDVPVPDVGGNPLDAQLAALEPIQFREPQERGAVVFAGLRVNNLRLRFGDAAWFSMRNARAQLGGALTVNKVGEDLRITGTLEGERGTYILEAGPILRTLEIVHAQVRFLGTPDINPALDITARRVVLDPDGSQFNVDVIVGGTLETPTLQLAAEGGGPGIPQSELLSYLLFGERSIGLSGQQLPGDVLLQETFLSGFAELATLEIERALGAPFDIFQVRLGPGPFGGIGTPRLVVGEELTRNVFLTVETGIAALFGGEQQDFYESWAARVEWHIDPRTLLSAGVEPVHRGRLVRGIGVALPVTRPQQQVTVEARRRWQW